MELKKLIVRGDEQLSKQWKRKAYLRIESQQQHLCIAKIAVFFEISTSIQGSDGPGKLPGLLFSFTPEGAPECCFCVDLGACVYAL